MRLSKSAVPRAASRLHLAMALTVSLALAAPAAAQESEFVGISMFGEHVPGGGGVEGASGDFDGEFDMEAGRICYYLDLIGVDGANGIAIHRGREGSTGEQVVALQLPGDDGDEVCVNVDAGLQREMLDDLERFYMVVTIPFHDDGAIRGQLSD